MTVRYTPLFRSIFCATFLTFVQMSSSAGPSLLAAQSAEHNVVRPREQLVNQRYMNLLLKEAHSKPSRLSNFRRAKTLSFKAPVNHAVPSSQICPFRQQNRDCRSCKSSSAVILSQEKVARSASCSSSFSLLSHSSGVATPPAPSISPSSVLFSAFMRNEHCSLSLHETAISTGATNHDVNVVATDSSSETPPFFTRPLVPLTPPVAYSVGTSLSRGVDDTFNFASSSSSSSDQSNAASGPVATSLSESRSIFRRSIFRHTSRAPSTIHTTITM